MTEPKRVNETADPPTETGVAAPILVVMGVSGTVTVPGGRSETGTR